MTRPHRTHVAQNGILGPEKPKSVTSRSVTWRCLVYQRESNLHQIVVTILCRLGPPFIVRGIGLFPVPENPPPSPPFLQKVTRNGAPQFGACLILSDFTGGGGLQKCTLLLAVALPVPNVLLGPISLGIFFVSFGVALDLCLNPRFWFPTYFKSSRGSLVSREPTEVTPITGHIVWISASD